MRADLQVKFGYRKTCPKSDLLSFLLAPCISGAERYHLYQDVKLLNYFDECYNNCSPSPMHFVLGGGSTWTEMFSY